MAVGCIPHSKIREYGIDDLDLAGDDLDFFIHLIRRIDSAYLSNEAGMTKSDPNVRDEVSISNVSGVKSLLARLGAAATAKSGQDRYRKSGKRNARKRHSPDNNSPA